MSTVKLIGIDEKSFEVDVNALKLSNYLRERANEGSIKLEIKDHVVELLSKFLEHHKNTESFKEIKAPLNSTELREIVDEWDANFINQDLETVFELINAGESLEIPYLHDLACAKIASFMKDKSTEEINQHFSIECQLTTDEAKQLGLEVDEN